MNKEKAKHLKVGDVFYKKYDRNKYHIVAILDEPEKQIVYKFYGIHKQWWHYKITELWDMKEWFKYNLYSFKRFNIKE